MNPFNVNVPLVNVVIPFVLSVSAAPKVVVPVLLIVNLFNVVLPFGVIVPVPTIVAVNDENEPPLESDKLFKFKLVVPRVNTVVPKSSLLNQLPVVKVMIDVPEPVNVRFGEIVDEPPVVPKVKVLVIEASLTKPPVPV